MTESAATASAVSKRRLIVQAVLRTDVGKVRSENQDFALLTSPEEEHGSRLLLVADGMGGHRGGATASRLAGETVKQQFLTAMSGDIDGLALEVADNLFHVPQVLFARPVDFNAFLVLFAERDFARRNVADAE